MAAPGVSPELAPAPEGLAPARAGTAALAGRLVGLKARILVNTLTRSTWVLVGTVLGAAYFVFLLGLAVVALFLLGRQDLSLVRTVLVLAGSAAVLAWWLLPILAARADATLDPARLALLPLSVGQVQWGQALGAVVGVPGALTVVALLATVSSWRSSAAALLAALLCVPLALALVVTGSRCVTALAVGLGRRRRLTELVSLAALVALVLLGPILTGLLSGLERLWDRLPQYAGVLAWTPVGAVWAVPADVAAGRWGSAAARLAVTVLTVVVLVLVWRVAQERALTSTAGGRTAAPREGAAGAGLLDLAPRRPWAAVAARCLVYWVRDPRYSAGLLVIPALAVLMWFSRDPEGGGVFLYALGPMIAALLAYQISGDVSYDNTALHLHVLTGVRGVHDRAGRVLALLVIAVPLTAAGLLLPFAVEGRWQLLPGVAGTALLALLGGAGLSSVMSARYTYPVAPPGASPLKTPQGFTVLNVLVQFVALGLILVLVLPAAVPLLVQVFTGDPVWGWAGLAAGAVLGPLLCWGGIVLGGRWYDRRAPELLQEVAQFR
ncbi:hypothetical protein [Kocuria rosea]|uniref:hypothetical protein n=1 Tax=Kocuria rosea TaxID=1275 RepID=UPI00201156BD|nr:hypothetical protein [Kocuria rosea]WJZ67889.1 hypothetical protein QR564_07335 [Kocuria rosea]